MSNLYPTQKEDVKYSTLYQGDYGKDPGNHSIKVTVANWSNQRLDVENPTVLDYGCGRAQLTGFVPYKTYHGVDVSSHQIGVNKEAKFRDASFQKGLIHQCRRKANVGYCIDVMEHIPEDFIDITLKTMMRCTDTLIMSIACTAASHTFEGENLHLTVRTQEWWLDKIKQYGEVQDLELRNSNRLLVFIGENYKKPDSVETPPGLIRIRESFEGELWITRKHPATERYMDAKYERLPNQLRWRPRGSGGKDREELRPLFEGKPCYYVGKGPSLDRLTKETFSFGDCPVIAVNDAIHTVEKLNLPNPLFCIQGDWTFKDKSYCSSPMFLQGEVSNFYPDVVDKYIYRMHQLGVVTGPGVLHAMRIAELLGATRHLLVSFDAMAEGETGYAECIGYEPSTGGDPKRFLDHRAKCERVIDRKLMSYITP